MIPWAGLTLTPHADAGRWGEPLPRPSVPGLDISQGGEVAHQDDEDASLRVPPHPRQVNSRIRLGECPQAVHFAFHGVPCHLPIPGTSPFVVRQSDRHCPSSRTAVFFYRVTRHLRSGHRGKHWLRWHLKAGRQGFKQEGYNKAVPALLIARTGNVNGRLIGPEAFSQVVGINGYGGPHSANSQPTPAGHSAAGWSSGSLASAP